MVAVVVVNFTVTCAPDSFRAANYDRHVLKSKLLYGQFNCSAT